MAAVSAAPRGFAGLGRDCKGQPTNAAGHAPVASPSMRAEDLDPTPAARACLQALRTASADVNGPMERHCLRTFLIAERLAPGAELDRELRASWLHDAGARPAVRRR